MIVPRGVPLFAALKRRTAVSSDRNSRKKKSRQPYVPLRRGWAPSYRCPFSPINPWAWSLPQETNME